MNKITNLREYRSKHLPAYMIPDQIISLKEFPLNSRGKIDYAALESEVSKKLPGNNTATQSDARSMLEQVWRYVLDIHAVHEDDEFFDLGATSLQAAHLTVRIRQTFGKSISLQDLYDNSHFGETLQFIEFAKNGEATEKITLIERDKDLNDSPLLALMPLLREPVLGELTRFETSQKTPIYRTNNTEVLADAADINYVPLSAEMFRMMFSFWVKKGYYAT